MTEYLSNSTEQTEEIATVLASRLKKGDFVAMYGDLGVGKTAFVRGLARVLAPTASVKSPTYTVVNEYKGEKVSCFTLTCTESPMTMTFIQSAFTIT